MVESTIDTTDNDFDRKLSPIHIIFVRIDGELLEIDTQNEDEL
jgi:hypothetical protein